MFVNVAEDFTPEQMQSVISLIQKNISLSNEIYRTAMSLINSTNDVKLSFVLLHTSLDEIGLLVDILTNQYVTLVGIFDSTVNVSKVSEQITDD